MGVDNFLESERIHLKNGGELIVDTMTEDGRIWKEVYYRKRGKTINIVSYSVYDYGMTRCYKNSLGRILRKTVKHY